MLHKNNIRHGDLKPENILWFHGENVHVDRGTLQIADLGLAQFHEKDADTYLRQAKGVHSMTPSGTSRYKPPQMDVRALRDPSDPRSRQYDIWSLGCVVLELLVWLVYGHQAMLTFRQHTEYFWRIDSYDPRTKMEVYVVHEYVDSCMNLLDEQLDENTAFHDLLVMVQTRLLVIDISPKYSLPSAPEYRAKAAEICQILQYIHDRCTADATEGTYLQPTRHTFPSTQIDESLRKRNIVYTREGKLAAPDSKEAGKLPEQRSLPLRKPISPTISISTPDGQQNTGPEIPRLALQAPTVTFDGPNHDSLMTQTSRITDHQEVSEVTVRLRN
jgi:serine/threonine protein kinase